MKIDLGQGVCATPWAGSLPKQGEQSGLSSINRVSQWPFFFVSVCLAPTRQTKPSWTGGVFRCCCPKGLRYGSPWSIGDDCASSSTRQSVSQSVTPVQTNLRRAISATFFSFFFFSLPQTVPLQCDACLPCQACEEANEPVPVPCLTCLIACVCEVLQHVCMARSLALRPQLSQHSTNPCTLGTMTSL